MRLRFPRHFRFDGFPHRDVLNHQPFIADLSVPIRIIAPPTDDVESQPDLDAVDKNDDANLATQALTQEDGNNA